MAEAPLGTTRAPLGAAPILAARPLKDGEQSG